MKQVLLTCGCVASATDGRTGKPACLWHSSKPVEASKAPDLTGRKARCAQCGEAASSDLRLAYFQHRPERDFDTYYCGCFGFN